MNEPQHTLTGNCSAPGSPDSDLCLDHPGEFRGECASCPLCIACDEEWEEERMITLLADPDGGKGVSGEDEYALAVEVLASREVIEAVEADTWTAPRVPESSSSGVRYAATSSGTFTRWDADAQTATVYRSTR